MEGLVDDIPQVVSWNLPALLQCTLSHPAVTVGLLDVVNHDHSFLLFLI